MDGTYDQMLEAERALDASVTYLAQMRRDFEAVKVTLPAVLSAAADYGRAKASYRFAVERYARGAT